MPFKFYQILTRQQLGNRIGIRLSIEPSLVVLVLCTVLCLPSTVHARDDLITLPVAGIFDNPEYAARLEGVQFYFGETPYAEVATDHGEFTANKKTNAYRKEASFACNWAMLSALLSLKDRALDLGADAVVDIRSYYKRNDFRGDTEFQCGSGNIMAGVTMIGRVVKFQ